ncbi:MAG: hypothetical protein SGILL_008155 [Bacillariaceae sp.]
MKMVQSREERRIQADLQQQLGDGPMRFGPVHVDPPLREQLLSHGVEGFNAFASVTAHWSNENTKKVYKDEDIMRLLRYYKFDERRTLGMMKRTDPKKFELNSFDQLEQLQSKTLFPIPGLKTIEGSNCFYMRPCRYFPNETSTTTIINNLHYVMDHYASQDVDLETGIAFIANMNDWTFENFSTSYCQRFMNGLQGRSFCAKVNLFLIVNPPGWFGKIWNIMKPMLSSKFQEQVHMIHEEELPFYFKTGCEKYLPDEFIEGEADTDQMVTDFIAYRNAMEKATGKVTVDKTFFGRQKGNTSGASKLRRLFGLGTSSHDRSAPKKEGRKAGRRGSAMEKVQDTDITETEVCGDYPSYTKPRSILAVK